MADPAPSAPVSCRLSIRLPRPLWIGVAATTLVVVATWLRFGVPIIRRYVAIRELEQIGGRLSFNKTGPARLRKYLGDSGMKIFDEVDWVHLNDTSFSDGHVKYLNVFTTVRGIELEGTQITDSGLSQFTNFASLDCLSLSRTTITDAGLVRTAELQTLTRLFLDDTRLGDGGLQHIGKIRNLRHLCAAGTNVTDAGLAHLSGMPALRHLVVNQTQITDLGLKCLIHCKKLSTLFVKETQVTVEGAAKLRAASWSVDVFGPDQKSQIARLQELLPAVRILDSLPGSY